MREMNDALLTKPAYWGYAVVAFLLLLVISLAYAWYKDWKEKVGGREPVYCAIATLVLGGSFAGWAFHAVYKDVQDVKRYGEQRTKYTVYVDGTVVDYANVHLEGYDLHFVDEEQKIIATTKGH